jgi:hypothetical protein
MAFDYVFHLRSNTRGFFFLVSGASLEGNFVLLLIAGHRTLLKFTCTREIGQRKVEKRKNE